MYDQPNDILINLLKAIQSFAPVLSGAQKIEGLVKGYTEATELVKKADVIKKELAQLESLSKEVVDGQEKLEKEKKVFEQEKVDSGVEKKAITSKALELEEKSKEMDKLQFTLDTALAEAKDEKIKAVAMYSEAEKSKKELDGLKEQLTKKINALNQIG